MICNKCGNQIPDNSAVCPNCGTPVSGGTQVPFGGAAGNGAKVAFLQQKSESINFIALIIAVIGLICVFPAKVTFSILGFDGGASILTGKVSGDLAYFKDSLDARYGIYMLALFIVTAVLLVLKKTNSALVPAAINAAFCLFKVIQELNTDSQGGTVGLNWAFWLMVVMAILEVVAILILPKLMANKNANPMM